MVFALVRMTIPIRLGLTPASVSARMVIPQNILSFIVSFTIEWTIAFTSMALADSPIFLISGVVVKIFFFHIPCAFFYIRTHCIESYL
jgi:hypothetical protein